nr:immunoglobulin heavy chain junction region [Mus musculus]
CARTINWYFDVW